MWHVAAVRRFARLISMRRLAAPATPGRERQAQIRLIASKWESDCSQVAENSHQAGREAAAGACWRAQSRVKAGKNYTQFHLTVERQLSAPSPAPAPTRTATCFGGGAAAAAAAGPGLHLVFTFQACKFNLHRARRRKNSDMRTEVARVAVEQTVHAAAAAKSQKRKNSTNDG